MRDYGKVHATFWSSETISELSDDGKLLALYLMTSTHGTIAGVFRLPDGYVCEDLKWSVERVSKGFQELFAKGFSNRCETTKWVWIVKHLTWNPPENPNQRKAVDKLAAGVPDSCTWKRDFKRSRGEVDTPQAPENTNPCETLEEPFINQKQEQKQEQKRGVAAKGLTKGSNLPADWTLPEDWREFADKTRPELDPEKVAQKFRDHWHGKPGKEGRKLDWLATWRNWVREERVSTFTKRTGGADDWTRNAR